MPTKKVAVTSESAFKQLDAIKAAYIKELVTAVASENPAEKQFADRWGELLQDLSEEYDKLLESATNILNTYQHKGVDLKREQIEALKDSKNGESPVKDAEPDFDEDQQDVLAALLSLVM